MPSFNALLSRPTEQEGKPNNNRKISTMLTTLTASVSYAP